MPAPPSSTAERRPVDFVYSCLGGKEPERVEAEGGDRAARTGLEVGIWLCRAGGDLHGARPPTEPTRGPPQRSPAGGRPPADPDAPRRGRSWRYASLRRSGRYAPARRRARRPPSVAMAPHYRPASVAMARR